MKKYLVLAGIGLSLSSAYAGRGAEDAFVVPNGQGVSSPSFWSSLGGQNPAGMTLNETFKLQAGGSTSDSFDTFDGSGGLLVGNGIVGAGVEYIKAINSGNANALNWALGGKIQSIRSSFGVSSQTVTGGGSARYNLGLLVEPNSQFRFGFMIPDLNSSSKTLAAGFAYAISSVADLVVDADYNSTFSSGTLKPGLTFRSRGLQLTLAYGLRYTGNTETFIQDRLSAGLGVVISQMALFSYQYNDARQHLMGLTLRFN